MQKPAPTTPDKPAEVLPRRQRATVTALIVLATLAVCGAAKLGAPFLIPVVVGILANYALEPFVAWLERIYVPRALGSLLVLLVLTALVAFGISLLRDDFSNALAELPNAAHKLRVTIYQSTNDHQGAMGHVRAAAAELNRAATEAANGGTAAPAPAPPSAPSALQKWVGDQSAKVVDVLVQIGIAGILAYFLLAAGDAYRRKLAHLAGPTLAARRITVEILDEIDAQVQRYLMTMLVLNTLIGIATWAILLAFGVHHAGLWGVAAAIVHIVPYVGSALTVVATGVATFVQFGEIGRALAVAALVGVAATLIGMGLATWMLGRAFRMNSVAVYVALLFFGWLWGGWGLVVGVPLLAVVKTTADRIPSLERIASLLGDDQRTTPAAVAPAKTGRQRDVA
jgi:predicted PurR-regulated permease PerM